jgi:hypothetical protein
MRAIELSVNFLVIIILGIAVFAGGIVLMRQIFTKSAEISTKLTQQNAQQLDDLMTSGQLVAVPTTQKTIARGGTDIFAIGINNELGVTADFFVTVHANIPNDNGVDFQSSTCEFNYDHSSININNNDNAKLGIGICVPRTCQPGTYILGIDVSCGLVSDPRCQPYYDTPKRLYIIVK